MTYQNDFTLSEALLEQLSAQGLDALPTLFQALLNSAMQIERQKHIGAASHERTEERTEERTGHANGYKTKRLPLASARSLSPSPRCVRAAFIRRA